MYEPTYLQAGVIGLLQGITELFPVSSLGHSVLLPALIGRSWQHLVTENASSHSTTAATNTGLDQPTRAEPRPAGWRR
nr:undecaprenyl-diphosphate phosphatase [Parafrankia discariae]